MRCLHAALALALLAPCASAHAQTTSTAASRKWEITDNSFLVEEAFNQETGVVQNDGLAFHQVFNGDATNFRCHGLAGGGGR